MTEFLWEMRYLLGFIDALLIFSLCGILQERWVNEEYLKGLIYYERNRNNF